MKAIILAGGFGTRLSEATQMLPKPMVEIGGMPILWHIMKTYGFYGINDFVICAGYKQHVIKEWFADYFLHTSDITFDFTKGNEIIVHQQTVEPWRVTVVDTGLHTQTGGRIKRVQKYIGDERFLLTYGDGVSDINVQDTIDRHIASGAGISMTVYKPAGKFGSVEISPETGIITSFQEKPAGDGSWVNAGYFVCEPEVFNYIPEGDDTVIFERAPLERLARDGKMMSYKHRGFWKPMDTLRDNQVLNKMWDEGNAPWKVWK